MKPELSAPAGNCDAAGNCHQIGVLSLDGAGHIAENIGTSFASPQVASISANVLRELQVGGEAPSTVLVKALQLHSAFVSTGRIDVDLVNYGGLGCPPDIDTILNCTQSSATCVFQIPVSVSPRFVRRPFPMPQCLVDANGRLVAEVFMTLYYDPPLDRRFRAEYCRTNVTASLGTLHMVRDPKTGEMKEQHARKVAPVPKELDEGWESELIKNGFKWSPLKLYHHRFRGMSGNAEWQLCLNLLERSEFTGIGSQDVYLLITIRDPAGEKEVYNEMVQSMQRLGWITENLQTRSRARLEG